MKGYVDSEEGQIHFRQAGDGEPLVLLHQVPSSSWMWDPLLEPLARRGYRAIAFDLPGYGMSDPPRTSPDLAYYARRIAGAASSLGLDRFGVVGHHTGGSIAIRMAVDHPDRVSGAVVYGLALLDADFAEQLATEKPPEYDADAGLVVKFWKARWGDHKGELARFIAARATAEMLTSMDHRADGHNAVGLADHVAMVRALTRPVLAVAGRRELLYKESQKGPELSEMVRFHELGDAGIDAVDEVPEVFADLIDGFFSQVAAAERAVSPRA